MAMPGKSVGIVGFPGLYGGAGVELDSQMTLWAQMGLELHIVPAWNPQQEPLLEKTKARATIHDAVDYKPLKDMPVISFCNDVFLRDITEIKEVAKQTIFVNCMTWLFDAEKKAHEEGLIDLFLYQSNRTAQMVVPKLEEINNSIRWKVFSSWFDAEPFPYHANRMRDKFRFGRVSREDGDKYSEDQLWIYESMVSPVPKSGIMLGFDHRSEKKIGTPPSWIRAYPACGITQQEFYAHSAAIIQKCDTTENWPRVGMEAMASGSVLVVDKRGGWEEMVKHGETGWLCEDQRDFVYYASRLAYEHEERDQMALNARDHLQDLVGQEAATESWKEVFEV
jgi:glycosyltransferase involved in cell wall biosynthesis